jgi:hypothetical protein
VKAADDIYDGGFSLFVADKDGNPVYFYRFPDTDTIRRPIWWREENHVSLIRFEPAEKFGKQKFFLDRKWLYGSYSKACLIYNFNDVAPYWNLFYGS